MRGVIVCPTRASKLASAYVEVKPDLSGFGSEARAGVDSETKNLGATVPIGADTTSAKASVSDLKAKLDALKADNPSPKVSVQIDAAEAQVAQIQARMDRLNAIIARPEVTPQMEKAYTELDALQTELDRLNDEKVTPEVQAKIDEAQARIAELNALLDRLEARDTEVRVKASADLLAAQAQLEAIKLKMDELNGDTVTVKVNADTSQAQGALSSLFSGGLTSPASIAGIGLGGGALLPALPGALTGAGAAAGTLGLAIAGVSKALSDYSTQQNSAAGATGKSAASQVSAANTIRTAQQAVSQAETQQAHDAVTSAEAIRNAQQGVAQAQTQAAHDAITSAESIKNAQQGVATATQQAAQSQISAEEQLKNAQYAEQQAQISLTQARQQAILTLQQLTNASADAALSVSQDQLNVQQAEQNQATVDANAKSTMLQREQAALSVKEAEQALKEAIQNRTNSAKAAQTADKQGVNGNPSVLAAEHAQQQAKQGVADAQRNLANVERAGAQAIAKAEQSLADAIRSASWQRVADAQNVSKAQQSLADASRNASWTQQADARNVANAQAGLKAAYASAGTAAGSASTATKQYAKDMAALTPAGRSFVTTITGMMGALHSLEGVSEKALLPGLTAFLGGLKSIGPEISKEVAAMGGLLSKGFEAIGRTLKSSGFQQELQTLFDEGNKFISILGPALGTITSDFLQMGAEAGPAVTGLAQGLSAILDGVGQLFLNLGKYAGAAGSILSTLGQAVGALGGPLGTVIGVLNSALAPLLAGALPLFRTLLQQIAGVVKSAQPGLTAIGQTLGQMLRDLTPLAQPLGALISSLVRLVTAALTPLLSSGMLPKLIGSFTQLAASVLPPVTKLISDLTPIIGFLSQATAAFVNVALGPLETGWNAVARAMTPISHAIDVISGALSRITGPISGFLGSFGGLFSRLTGGAGNASTATDGLAGSVHGLGDSANTASGMISGLNDSFTTLVGNFTGKQQSVLDTASAIQQYGQDVSQAGAGSSQAQQGFLDAVNAIGQMATALQQAHTPMATVYQDIENQITALQNKGPLNKSERQDLENLKDWADHLADSSQHLSFEQQSVADTMENHLIPQLVDLGVKSSTAKSDTDDLTNAIVNTGKQSDATKDARKRLIDDLKQSGVNADTATGLVDSYIKKLGKIPAKDATQILLSGTGQWSIKESNIYPTPSGKAPNPILHPNPPGGAAGMMVRGGIPGKDSVLINAMPGELVVPVPLVNSGAVDHLRGAIPGFGTGGYVGQGTSGLADFGQKRYTAEWSGMVSTMEKDMAAAVNAAVAAAKASAATGAGGPVGGDQARNKAIGQKMVTAAGWGSQFAAFNDIVMAESGWNRTITNGGRPYNSYNVAYGIPQALPASKMGPAANPPTSSASAQIGWMINYIRGRYTNPDNAWAFHQAHGSYDQGGWLPPGRVPVNGLRKPEAVLTPEQSAALLALGDALTRRSGASGGGPAPRGGVTVVNNWNGTQMPTPEQEQALLLKLGAAIGVA